MNQELAIKVEEVVAKSGVPLEVDITEVVKLAERGRAIESVDDPNFLPVKREMQKTRKTIKEYMFDARAEFNRMAKGVIEVEKAVLDEFVGEENRLITLDKAEKERVLKEERLEALPAKRERITENGIEFTDEEILEMTDADFELEFATRLSAKLEADRIADEERREAEQAKIDAEKAEIQRQKDEANRIEQARKEEQERAEERLRLEKERAEREKKEAEERRKAEEEERRLAAERAEQEEKDRIEREKKEVEEAEAKRLADENFQTFLKENNYNMETDLVNQGLDGSIKLYRLVAEYEG